MHDVRTTENAAKTQLWIAICTYVVAVLAHRALKAEISMSQMLQIFQRDSVRESSSFAISYSFSRIKSGN
jgi:hypothetical protein